MSALLYAYTYWAAGLNAYLKFWRLAREWASIDRVLVETVTEAPPHKLRKLSSDREYFYSLSKASRN